MNVNLEWYRIFCNVVKYGNITKAAEKMYLSQPAITQSINKLEEQLGGSVFVRSTKGVELTSEGKALYDYILKSMDTISNAENIFSQYIKLEEGNIRIGAGNSLMMSIAMEPIKQFSKDYPNVTFCIENKTTAELIYKLSVGELDIVLLHLPFKENKYSDIQFKELRKIKDCFFATKEYLKDKNITSIKDLENEKLILPVPRTNRRKLLDEYCKQNDINLKPFYEVSSFTVARELAMDNWGIALDDELSLKGKKGIQILDIDIPQRNIGYATLDKNIMAKSVIKFIEYLEKYNMK